MSIPTNSYYLTLKGIRIHIFEQGDEGAPAIIFIHGRCLSVSSWMKQFESDLFSSYRLIAIDLPGHGLSEQVPNNPSHYSLRSNAGILIELVHLLHLERVILVGHSLGGYIALQSLPDLAECQGVFAMTMPLSKPMQFERMYQDVTLLMDVYQHNTAPDRVNRYIQSLLRPNASLIPEFLDSDFYRTDPNVHFGLTQGILANEYEDETEIIQQSKQPIAIVEGCQEQVHNLAYLQNLSLPLWQDKPLLIPDAGHMVQWENARSINELLHSFCTGMAS